MNTEIILSRLVAYALDGVGFDTAVLAGADYNELMLLAKKHGLVAVAAYALEKLSAVPEEYSERLKKEIKLSMLCEATQEMETREIIRCLEERGIRYMLLKGSVMKNIYPLPYLRSMCDVDIQYDTGCKSQLDGFMTELGYKKSEVSGTDGINIAYLKKPFMYVEFHGALMDKDVPLYNRYFGTNFERTVPTGGCEVKYNDEDFFVFMAAHLAKHYFLGGSGVRSLADIWLYLRKKPEMDKKYIFAQLKKIKLDEFIMIMLGVNAALFDGATPTKQQSSIISYVFGSGTYGTVSNSSVEKVKNQSKGSYVKQRLFPGRDFMAINYPLVKKCILLLPLFWVIRLISVFFKKGYKGSDVETVINIDAAQIDARKIPGNPKEYKGG